MTEYSTSNSAKTVPKDQAGSGGAWRQELATLLSELQTTPPSADRGFRDALAQKLVAAANVQASKSFVGDINDILGSVHHIVQPTAKYQGDRGLKSRAISILKAATAPTTTVNDAPKRRKVSHFVAPQEKQFNAAILGAAERHKGDPQSYIDWLKGALESKASLWTPANITTAAYGLCKHYSYSHTQPSEQSRPWERLGSPAAEIAALVTQKVHEMSRVDVFDQLSASNLCSTLPAILTALTLGRESTRGLDQVFLESVSRALRYCDSPLATHFLAPMVFVPVGRISSVHLSPAGQTALCELARLTVDVTDRAEPVPTLTLVGANFHALKGVAVWSNSSTNQSALTATLRSLNDRLEVALSISHDPATTSRGMDCALLAQVSAGLSGVDFNALTSEARAESARAIQMLSQHLAHLDHNARAESLGLLVHNLGTALDTNLEPVRSAVNTLLDDVRIAARRTKISTLDEVGYLCAALVSLHPLRHSHWELIRALWSPIESVDHRTLSPTAKRESELKCWASIHQAFALYPKRISPPLLNILNDITPRAYEQAQSNKSDAEARIAHAVRTIPGVKVLPPTIAYGFELDVLIELPNGHRLNIEADGLHHSEPGKRRSCQLVRDPFLHQNGITVIRFNAETHTSEVVERVGEIIKRSGEAN